MLFCLTFLFFSCHFIANPWQGVSQQHTSSSFSDTTKLVKDEPLLVKASVAQSMINDTVIRNGTNLSHSSKLSNATAHFLIMKIISMSGQVLFQFVTMALALCPVWSVVEVGYSSLCDAMKVLFANLQSFTSSDSLPSQVDGFYNFSKVVGNLFQIGSCLFRTLLVVFLFFCFMQHGEAAEIRKHEETFALQISKHDFSQKDTLCDAVIEQIIQVHLLHTDLKQFKKRGLSLLDDLDSSLGDESQTIIENLTFKEAVFLCKKTEEPVLCSPEDYPKKTSQTCTLKEKKKQHANSLPQHVIYSLAHELDRTNHRTGSHFNISQYLNKNPTEIKYLKNLFYDFMPQNLAMENNETILFLYVLNYTVIFFLSRFGVFSSYNEYGPVRVAYEFFKIVPIILSFYCGHLLLLMFFILPIQPLVESIFRRYFTNNIINIDVNQESDDQSSHSSTKVYWKGPKKNVLPHFSTLECLMPSRHQDEFILVSNSVVHSRALYHGQGITPLIDEYQLEGIRSYGINIQINKEDFLWQVAAYVEIQA